MGRTRARRFPRLISWTDSPDAGVRDYSGTATYIQDFDLPKTLPGRVVLDLGKVDVIASVAVNGQSFGDVWKLPFAADVTPALHPGKNHLEVKIANLWTNRLIADAKLPETQRLTWTNWPMYRAGAPRSSSGLLGPVVLRDAAMVPGEAASSKNP